jgi:hypothetical protein
MNTTQIKRLY